jgi:predicted SprT family Zn-dependent metalloprotease
MSDRGYGYRCDGCGTRLESREDLTRQQGVTGSAWFCRQCGTSVPGVVGEKLKHRE